MVDLIIDKQKEIKKLQYNIKSDDIELQQKERNIMVSVNIHYLLLLEGILLLENADKEQSELTNKVT